MGTLTTRPVVRVSAIPSSGQTPYTKSGIAYDWAIGGLPFFSATAPDRPLDRKTAPLRKDQFDATTEPGEQSLTGWWLRSQSSFHGGAGIKFQESDNTDIYSPLVKYEFADSRGLDVFTTKGQATLLPDTALLKATTGVTHVHGCQDGNGVDIALVSDGTSLFRVDGSGTATAITWGGAGTIQSISDDGTNYYVTDTAGIYKGTLAGGAGTKIYTFTVTNSIAGFVKGRLMFGGDNAVYELDANAGANTSLPAAKYTHKSPGWLWTGFTETPASILAVGNDGSHSDVFKFVLDTSGVVPMLSGAISTALMPEGEIVTAIYCYLGDYVALGSNRGVRIATVDGNGDIQYGPLSVKTTTSVNDFVGRDRFIYAAVTNGIDGDSGLYVIDLSMQIGFRLYAYSTHLQSGVAGNCLNVGLLGASDRLVFGVSGHGAYVQHATNLVASGWLQTGNIRFHTIEPKLFKYVLVRGDSTHGSIAAAEIDPAGNSTSIVSYSGLISMGEAALNSVTGPVEYVAMKFTLTRDAGLTTGPTLTGWQVKALPATKRQRLYVIPLLCFDQEVDKHGKRVGRVGTAVTRLEALEALEEAADLVVLQDLNQDPTTSRLVVIDDLEFRQIDPPGKFSGWGGVVYITVRAVT